MLLVSTDGLRMLLYFIYILVLYCIVACSPGFFSSFLAQANLQLQPWLQQFSRHLNENEGEGKGEGEGEGSGVWGRVRGKGVVGGGGCWILIVLLQHYPYIPQLWTVCFISGKLKDKLLFMLH